MNNSRKEFIEMLRGVVQEIQENYPKEKWARLTAFSICGLLDGSGEFGDSNQKFKVVTTDNKPVEFIHHDL